MLDLSGLIGKIIIVTESDGFKGEYCHERIVAAYGKVFEGYEGVLRAPIWVVTIRADGSVNRREINKETRFENYLG